MSVVSLALSQILVLFIFILLGYVFNKKNVLGETASAVISRLIVNIFMPALCFNTFAGNFTMEILREKSAILIMAVIVMGATFLPALLLSRLFTKNPLTRGVFFYAFMVPNFGYMGYPLIQAVYGEAALLNFMIVGIPYNVFVYTAGRYILSADKKFNLRNILDPSFMAVIAGAVFGLTGLTLPAFLGTALNMAAACMVPLAMIMPGFVLARTPFKFSISNPKIYLASLLRLLVIPLATGAILLGLHVRMEVVLIITTFLCMPMGLNNVIFPEAYGGDSGTGAQCCFVSQVLILVTIPCVFALTGKFG